MKRKQHRHASRLGLIVPALFMAAAFSANASPGSELNNIQKYRDLSAEWWQWAIATGFATLEDPDGSACAEGQSGKTWFLAGTSGVAPAARSCTVPHNKELFFPLLNTATVLPPGDPETPEEARAGLQEFVDNACQLRVTLDGEPLIFDNAIVRVQSPLVKLDDPLELFPPGSKLIADGHWVGIRRLPNGEHTLAFHGATCIEDPDDASKLVVEFEVDVTYNLIIE